MTMKLIKAPVGIVAVLALFACSTENPGSTAGSGGAGPGTTGSSGAGGGTTGAATGGATGSSTGGGTGMGTGGATGATGGAGTGGTAGGAGSGGQGGAGGTGPADESVLERGKRPSRDGNYVQSTLTTAAAMKVMPDAAFNTNAAYTGQMFASPLYLANGPGGKGIFIAATSNNDVKAFDDSGMPVWTRNFGAFAAGATFTPKGVMGTPVIDPTAGPDGFATIYACAPVGATAGAAFNHYELHAISAKDGSERPGWPAKLDGTVKATNDGLNRVFNPVNHAQRPALSLVNGVVYVGFGGPFGDFSMYYGWVIAVDTKNPATVGAWSTRLAGGAIWTPGGFASDGNGVIITTGNYWAGSFSAPAMYGDTESIIRITGTPSTLTRSGAYYPARWRQLDTDDQDFGASSVMLLNVPGSTPSSYAVSASKDAHLYFVDSAKLGIDGGGGESIDLTLSTSNHSQRTSPVAYTTASGIHVALTVDRGPYMGCPASSMVDPAMAILMGFTVMPGSPIKVTPNWCTTIGGPTMSDLGTIRNRSGSPLVTTTDGKSQPVIWVGGNTSQVA